MAWGRAVAIVTLDMCPRTSIFGRMAARNDDDDHDDDDDDQRLECHQPKLHCARGGECRGSQQAAVPAEPHHAGENILWKLKNICTDL